MESGENTKQNKNKRSNEVFGVMKEVHSRTEHMKKKT